MASVHASGRGARARRRHGSRRGATSWLALSAVHMRCAPDASITNTATPSAVPGHHFLFLVRGGLI